MRIEPRFEPREVVWANFKFEPDQKIESHPILIISKYSINPEYSTFNGVPITSIEVEEPFVEPIRGNDMEEGSFERPSQVVCYAVNLISKDEVTRRKGKVTLGFYSRVIKNLKNNVLEL